jgi:hypothetical protein
MRRTSVLCLALLAIAVVALTQRGGPLTVAQIQPIPDAVKGALEHSEEQLRAAATAGMTDSEIDELQSIAVLCAQGQPDEAGGKWDVLLRGMKGRGVGASFGTGFEGYMAPRNGNIMDMLFLVFRQSVVQQNEDKRYFLEKLEQYNELSDALRVYVEALNAILNVINAPGDEKEPAVLRKPLTAETGAERTVVSYEQVTLATTRQATVERRRATARLRMSEQKAEDAREEIYKRLQRDPKQLNDYQSLQDLLLARAEDVYLLKPPSPRIAPAGPPD